MSYVAYVSLLLPHLSALGKCFNNTISSHNRLIFNSKYFLQNKSTNLLVEKMQFAFIAARDL